MKYFKIKILSWLLHHANRHTKSEHFYAIKNRILKKYGVFKQYDVQFIEGKKCHSCGGTGIYHGFSEYSGRMWRDCCNRCWAGWYRQPVWNILERLQFGKYTFHQPWKRSYDKPDVTVKIIEGYIDHKISKHGKFALTFLFLMYDRKRWWAQYKRELGIGFRVYWWYPRNWIHNIAYFYKDIRRESPVHNFSKKIKIFCNKFGLLKINQRRAPVIIGVDHQYCSDDDLPF